MEVGSARRRALRELDAMAGKVIASFFSGVRPGVRRKVVMLARVETINDNDDEYQGPSRRLQNRRKAPDLIFLSLRGRPTAGERARAALGERE